MNIPEIMAYIESYEFDARLNVASDFRTFLRGIQQQKAVIDLLKILDTTEAREEVVFRIADLARQQVDPAYENRWDTALAVYLWLLNQVDLDLSKSGARYVLNAPQCWWALKLARQVLQTEPTVTHADFTQYGVLWSFSSSTDVSRVQDTENVWDYVGFISTETRRLGSVVSIDSYLTENTPIPSDQYD
ncbi:MAG: hypothetical protein HY326_10150 [Chloroflexi bacterium]|nr:hypothetical protein [Chloroflexota bacterium]